MNFFFLLLLFFVCFGVPSQSYAQTDRELLLELVKQQTELSKQVAETNKQVAETNKQVAVNSAEIKGLDKRIDTQSNLILGMMGLITLLIGVLIWDRRAANAPLEAKTAEMQKEINLLKEKELKHQEKELKNESLLKRLLEKFPDLAGLA